MKKSQNIRIQDFLKLYLLYPGGPKHTDPDPQHCLVSSIEKRLNFLILRIIFLSEFSGMLVYCMSN